MPADKPAEPGYTAVAESYYEVFVRIGRLIIAATLGVAALGMLLGFAGAAAADSTGPITFESTQGYVLGR